jgi:hypothetical protein
MQFLTDQRVQPRKSCSIKKVIYLQNCVCSIVQTLIMKRQTFVMAGFIGYLTISKYLCGL